MLHEAQRTSAPRASSVSIGTGVWIVICSEPQMRAPRSGWRGPNSSRVAIRPGISVSAMAISLRPHSARLMSLTTWSAAAALAVFDAAFMMILRLAGILGPLADPHGHAYSIAAPGRQRRNKDV